MLITTEGFDGIKKIDELLLKNNSNYIPDPINPIQLVPGRHGSGVGSPYGEQGQFTYSIPEDKRDQIYVVGFAFRFETTDIPDEGIPIVDFNGVITVFGVKLNSNLTLSILSSGAVLDTSTILLNPQVWYYLEFKVLTGFKVAALELRVNTKTVASSSEFVLSSKFSNDYNIDAFLIGRGHINHSVDTIITVAPSSRVTQVFEEVITSVPVLSPARITQIFQEVIVKP